MVEEPTYRESIQIGWTLLWRCLGGFLVLLFAVNLLVLYFIPELTRTEPSLWISLLPVGVAALVSLFVIMPVIIRAMLSKSFHGFHLRLIRGNQSPHRVETTHSVSR
ncbi:MAG: hypothetical protein ABI945_08855 [Nitrospirales bacterium]